MIIIIILLFLIEYRKGYRKLMIRMEEEVSDPKMKIRFALQLLTKKQIKITQK